MKAVVNLFPKQRLSNPFAALMCSIYSKDDIEYRIFYVVNNPMNMHRDATSLDTAMSVLDYERERICRLSVASDNNIRQQINAHPTVGRSKLGIITGYLDEQDEWYCDEVPGHRAHEVLGIFAARAAYQEGSSNFETRRRS